MQRARQDRERRTGSLEQLAAPIRPHEAVTLGQNDEGAVAVQVAFDVVG